MVLAHNRHRKVVANHRVGVRQPRLAERLLAVKARRTTPASERTLEARPASQRLLSFIGSCVPASSGGGGGGGGGGRGSGDDSGGGGGGGEGAVAMALVAPVMAAAVVKVVAAEVVMVAI